MEGNGSERACVFDSNEARRFAAGTERNAEEVVVGGNRLIFIFFLKMVEVKDHARCKSEGKKNTTKRENGARVLPKGRKTTAFALAL